MKTVKLVNGVEIPIIGLGVFRAGNDENTVEAIKHALKSGYRHIDTAYRYGNEESVGIAVKESGIPREEIFITSKAGNPTVRARETYESFHETLANLQTDYVDLYLIHWPVDGMLEAWKTIEGFYKEGKIRAIGVSNFHQNHLDELATVAEIMPMVNQVESNPQFNNDELIANCRAQGMVMEAWSPLGGGRADTVRQIKTLEEIGKKYNKSAVQVIIRWDVQRNVITLPKSVTKERIEDNINVFDFELSDEDMATINALNKNIRSGADPDNFDF